MPIYEVTAPNGRVYEITAPEGATIDDAIAYAQQQYGEPAASKNKDQERSFARTIADLGVSFAQGAVDVIRAVAAVGGADNVVAETLGDASKGLDKHLRSDFARRRREQHNRAMEAASDRGMLAEAGQGVANFVDAPFDYTAQGFGSVAGLWPALKTAGLTAARAGLGALGTKALQFGAVGAPTGVGATKLSQYEEVHDYLRGQGVPEDQARARAAAAQSYGANNAAQHGIGAVLGGIDVLTGGEAAMMGGKKRLLNTLRARGVNALRRGGEEFGTEFVQAGHEKFAGNLAAIDAGDTGRDPLRGVVGAATQEGLMGGGPGAIMGMAERGRQAPAPVTETGGIQAEQPVAGENLGTPESPAPFSDDEKAGITQFAQDRAAEIERKATGIPEQTITGSDGTTVVIPGEQPQYLTQTEKEERDFLARNASDPDAVAKAYGIQPAPKTQPDTLEARNQELIDLVEAEQADQRARLAELNKAMTERYPSVEELKERRALEKALQQPSTPLPGISAESPAAQPDTNGFIAGPNGYRVRISEHKAGSNFLDPTSDIGAIIYEVRKGDSDSKPLNMVLGKDGKLVEAGTVIDAAGKSNGTAWVPRTAVKRDQVIELLQRRATTEIGSQERRDIDERIAEIVTGKVGHDAMAPQESEPPAVNVRTAPRKRPASDSLIQAIINRGGISRSIMQDVGADPAGRYQPGLFTSNGTSDLSELAGYLFDEDGFHQISQTSDIGPARELEELIGRAIGGERILNTDAMERELQAELKERHKQDVLRLADEYGVARSKNPRDIEALEAKVAKAIDAEITNAGQITQDTRNAALDAGMTEDEVSAIEDAIADEDEFNGPNLPRDYMVKMWRKITKTLKEKINDRERSAAQNESRSANQADDVAATGNEASREDARPEAAAGFALEQQTEADLATKAARENDQALADKETADAQREAFGLSRPEGSAAPKAVPSQQTGLFNAKGEAKVADSEANKKLDTDFRLNPIAIINALTMRGQIKDLHKQVGVRGADAFDDLPMDAKAAAYVKLVNSGVAPVKVDGDYNARVAKEEHDIEVRRMQSEATIMRSDGKPFKSKTAAQKVQTEFDLTDTHAISEVDGGFVLRRMGEANRPSAIKAAEDRRKADPSVQRQEAAFARAELIGDAAKSAVDAYENGDSTIDEFEAALDAAEKVGAGKAATEFIKAPDGSIDFGEITQEQAKTMRRQAGKIRLERGWHDSRTNEGSGLVHIEARRGDQIRRAGYASIEEFVLDAVRHIDSIWRPGTTSQIIAVQAGNKGKVMFLELTPAKDDSGDYYRVNSAFFADDSYVAGKEKKEGWKELWSRVPVPASAHGEQSDFASAPSRADGVSSMDRGQSSDTNIADQQEEGNTEDAGEELSYNRRNRSGRLKWDDIKDQEAALRVKEVTKAKVYPKPDYAELADEIGPVKAHLVKQVYDHIATTPQAGRDVPTDAQLESYIDAVNRIMDATIAWAKDAVFESQWRPTANGKSLLDTIYPEGWRAQRDEIVLLDGNRYFGGVQPGYDEIKRAEREIAKGWPGKREAWQTQGYKVVETAEGVKLQESQSYDKKVYYLEVGGRYFGSVPSKADGEKMIADMQPWLLLNKQGRIVSQHQTEKEVIEAARNATKRSSSGGISDKGIAVENAERIGPSRRMEVENVTSDQLKETFGFRGVNFGTWMKGKANEAERQLHLNHAYDAFFDLAEIIGVPPKAMSLNGMLGLAIGAQGNGKYLRHEPCSTDVQTAR